MNYNIRGSRYLLDTRYVCLCVKVVVISRHKLIKFSNKDKIEYSRVKICYRDFCHKNRHNKTPSP